MSPWRAFGSLPLTVVGDGFVANDLVPPRLVCPVLSEASLEVVGDPDVEEAVAGSVEPVDPVLPVVVALE